MYRLFKIILLASTVPFVVSGCLKDLSIEEQGAAAGVVVGGTVGFLACRLKGNSAKDCRVTAAVGAVGSGIAGGLYGRSIQERRDAYASDEDFYDAQLADLKEVNNALETERTTIDQLIQSANDEVESITNELSSTQEKSTNFESTRTKILEDKRKLDERIKEYKQELEVNQQILTDSETKGAKESEKLAEEIARLQEQIASLDGKSEELASISSVTF